MGGHAAYSQRIGGFVEQKWMTVDVIDGYKAIYNEETPNSIPSEMSVKPNATYLIKNKKGYIREIAIYGKDCRLKKTIHVNHRHGDIPMGTAHVHNHRGGREANVRRMNKKEIKNYRHIVFGIMGG